MGKKTKAAYVQYGSKVAALKTLLPGIKVSILGPPTIKQKADVLNQNPVNKKEYWHFAQFWALRAAAAGSMQDAPVLFPNARAYRTLRQIPIENRWFVRRQRALRGEQLLGLVRSMDDALNNTSVILLFEAGGKKLLFPGDAQWENWELALNKNAAAAEGRGHLQGRAPRQPERDAEDALERVLAAVRQGGQAGPPRHGDVDAKRQQARARGERHRGAAAHAGQGVEAATACIDRRRSWSRTAAWCSRWNSTCKPSVRDQHISCVRRK